MAIDLDLQGQIWLKKSNFLVSPLLELHNHHITTREPWVPNIARVRSRPVPGRKGPGRPKKTWDECVKQDLKVCGLSEAGTKDRVSWRSSVKNSRQEPTPSKGSAPQSMAAPPALRVLGMHTRSFNKTGFDWLIDMGQRNADFDPNWVFPYCNSGLNSLMAMKWCTMLEAT